MHSPSGTGKTHLYSFVCAGWCGRSPPPLPRVNGRSHRRKQVQAQRQSDNETQHSAFHAITSQTRVEVADSAHFPNIFPEIIPPKQPILMRKPDTAVLCPWAGQRYALSAVCRLYAPVGGDPLISGCRPDKELYPSRRRIHPGNAEGGERFMWRAWMFL